MAGPFSEIGAMGPDASEASYTSLAIQLDGTRGIPARWEVARGVGRELGVLTAASATAEVERVFDEPHARDGDSRERAAADSNTETGARATLRGQPGAPAEASAGIAAFAELIESRRVEVESWRRSVRAMELADSIEISLRRGRRIEVHYRQMTEETSYKGMMSAMGCGLLLLAPLALVTAGMLSAVFGWRILRFWYAPVLAVLMAFLVVQILARMVARRSD
jgi:hypothetical protein